MNAIQADSQVAIAESYYAAMIQKDFETMGEFLDERIQFISPLATLLGKAAVINAARNLMQDLDKITIRARFSTGDQVMLAYDFWFPELNLQLSSAVLMNISNEKIKRIELFYDAKAFDKK